MFYVLCFALYVFENLPTWCNTNFLFAAKNKIIGVFWQNLQKCLQKPIKVKGWRPVTCAKKESPNRLSSYDSNYFPKLQKVNLLKIRRQNCHKLSVRRPHWWPEYRAPRAQILFQVVARIICKICRGWISSYFLSFHFCVFTFEFSLYVFQNTTWTFCLLQKIKKSVFFGDIWKNVRKKQAKLKGKSP